MAKVIPELVSTEIDRGFVVFLRIHVGDGLQPVALNCRGHR